MAFIGVRMSWLMLERNVLFALLLCSAWTFCFSICFSRPIDDW